MKKFHQQWRSWELEQLNKSRRERRREQAMWVQRLQSNLCKINCEIERQGDKIQELFKDESEARKKFESQKERGVASEKRIRQEIKVMKQRLLELTESNQQVNFSNFERI